jgi:hypothetical protein
MSTTTMFEDQTVELLPARTTMKRWGGGGGGGGKKGGGGTKIVIVQIGVAFGGNNSTNTVANTVTCGG